MQDDPEPELAWYLLDGLAIRLDPLHGPLTPGGERVDCVAWMDRAVSVSREDYLAAVVHAVPHPKPGPPVTPR